MPQKLEYTVLDLIESATRNTKAHPLNLGGIAGAGGGLGAPPGGFIGRLPQWAVTYDIDEAATLDTLPSGLAGASGWSLVDNLNHIRYRLNIIESGGSIVVLDDNEIIDYPDTTHLHFSGAGITINDLGDGHVQVVVEATGSGGGSGIDEEAADALYLRLDAANSPVTGELRVEVVDGPSINGQAFSVIANDPLVNRIAIDGESHNNYALGLITFNYGVAALDQSIDDGAAHTEEAVVLYRYKEPGQPNAAILAPAYHIVDESDGMTFSGGVFRHTLDGNIQVNIDPYTGPTGIVVLFDSVNTITASGRMISLKNNDVEVFAVTGSGIVDIPTGATYNIGGVPHTHAGGGSSSSSTHNYAINGGFNFAQRQAAGTLTTIADKKYGADRWMLTRENADVQYHRNSAIAESGLNSTYYGLIKKITNAGKFMTLQVVEHINTVPLRGQSVTFEIKMKASGSKTIRMALIELNTSGTADTLPGTLISAWGADGTDPTLGTNLAIITSAESKSVTTTWTKFSVTKTIPSNSKNVICAIWSDADFSANDTLSLAEAGLYIGTAPTNWAERTIADEFSMCQRYYEKSYNVDISPGTGGVSVAGVFDFRLTTAAAAFIMWPLRWRVDKRIAPTIRTWDDASGNNLDKITYITSTAGAQSDNQSRTIDLISTAGCRLYSDSGTSKCGLKFSYDADAEIY